MPLGLVEFSYFRVISLSLAEDAERDEEGVLDLMNSLLGERPAEGLTLQEPLVEAGNLLALDHGRLGKSSFPAV